MGKEVKQVRYDVAVIGGGITGVLTARALSRYSLRVAVLEAADDVAMGATKANSAIVHAGFDPKPGSLKASLNVKGCEQMSTLTKELDVPFRRIGSLVVAFGEEDDRTLLALKERGIENGVPGLEIWDRERLTREEPNLSKEASSALFAPTAGIVCPYELCIAAAESASVNGVDFYFRFRVSGILRTEEGFRITDGSETVETRYLVNAAGVHADEIASLAGEKDFPVRIVPRRGEYMLLDRSVGNTASHVLFVCPSVNGKGILVSPTVDGNLLLGPTAAEIQDRDDTATTAEGLAAVADGARKLVPGIRTNTVITQFSGIRPTPIDRNGASADFLIRPSDQIPGLLHLAGIESPGLASSPAVSEYAVSLLFSMGLKADPNPEYQPGRPRKIRFREMNDEERRDLIAMNSAFGKIICRCESVTEGEIVDAIRRPLGARDLDMIKRRTRAGMGRCGSGFCSPRVMEILSRELGIPMDEVTKCGGKSYLIPGTPDSE